MIQQPAMSEPKARVWKKIVCFYALTMLFSSVCGAFVLHAGKMDAGNLLYVTGAMWSLHASHKLFLCCVLRALRFPRRQDGCGQSSLRPRRDVESPREP